MTKYTRDFIYHHDVLQTIFMFFIPFFMQAIIINTLFSPRTKLRTI